MPFGSGQGDQFARPRMPFILRGLQLAKPANMMEPGDYPFIKNVRVSQEGKIETRFGVQVLASGFNGPHSIFRLNDTPFDIAGGFGIQAYYVGDPIPGGGALYYSAAATGPFVLVEAIYSGDPMMAIEGRPERSPSPLLYLTDGSMMRKVNSTGQAAQWGIFPPLQPPSMTLFPAEATSITDCTSANPEAVAENGAVWARQQNATVAMSQVNRTNTTISAILYDSGTTGYANIQPAAMGTDIQPGQRIRINDGGGTAEYVTVEQTFPAIATTTIESIVYHSGAAGLCTIQLATPTTGLVANTMVRINSAENVRVLSVTNGPDGKPCFRCVTSGTFSAGQSVSGFRNFRASTANNHAAAETLITRAYEFQIDPDNAAPLGIGAVSHNISLDLSSAGGRPITEDDEISIGLYFAEIDRLVEGKVMIDLDAGTASGSYAATDLTRNYLFYPFRKEDIQLYASPVDATTQVQAGARIIQFRQIDTFNERPVRTIRDPITGAVATYDEVLRQRNLLAQQLETDRAFVPRGVKQRLIQRYDETLGQVGEGGGIYTQPVEETGEFQAGSGREQWYQLRFKVGDLVRVGTDQSKSLKDSTSFRLQLNLSGTTATVIRFSSVWIGGTYGPDSQTDSDLLGDAYYYRFVGRNSLTGEFGLPSPPTRAGVIGRRQKRTINLAQHPDPQVDKLDIYRYGGTILQWVYIGTVNNGVNPTFNDNLGDEDITANPLLSFENFPPVPTADKPRTGNCNVVGTRVTRTSGAMFNTKYSPGTEIVLNGKTFLAYAQPEDTNTWELTESAGTISGGTFELPNAIILGNPLPCTFGPYGQGSGGLYWFFLGDKVNPGVLYWSNGNDPNSVSDLNSLEVTGPSEPLTAGCIYDGRPYVWSEEKMYAITENLNPQLGESRFRADEVANSKGCMNRLAVTVDTLIYFQGKDGIYESEGGQPRSITDDSLYSLFQHEGIKGKDFTLGGTSAFIPHVPTLSAPTTMTRLVSDGQYVRLTYFDEDGVTNYHMLLFDKRARRWLYDKYPGAGIKMAYYEDLPRNRLLMSFGSTIVSYWSNYQDDAQTIPAVVVTQCQDFGEPRAQKELGDQMLDLAGGLTVFTVNTWLDNYTTLLDTALFNANGRQIKILDPPFANDEVFLTNIALEITHQGLGTNQMELYEWQPAVVPKPENTFERATDWELSGGLGAKFLQGLLIEADTDGVEKEIIIESADGGVIETLAINHARQLVRAYSLSFPTVGTSFRIRPFDDSVTWKLFNVEWIWEPAPEEATTWKTQGTNNDVCGWFITREGYVSLISDSEVTFTVTLDGAAEAYTIPSTAGQHRKVYLPLRARKGKLAEYSLTAETPFRLFKKDTCIMIAPWGRTEQMIPVKPFGGDSRRDGATI